MTEIVGWGRFEKRLQCTNYPRLMAWSKAPHKGFGESQLPQPQF
jgi:hypothetical protein